MVDEGATATVDAGTATETQQAASGISETPGGVSVSVNTNEPTAGQLAEPTETQKAFLNTVPPGYSEKGWVKELIKAENPNGELFKQMEGLQAMRGQKAEGLKVPGEGATEADWQAWHKAIGVPEKPEDYAYEAPKPPEGQEALYQTDEKFLSTMRTAAHKAGVTPAGWQKMTAEYNTFVDEAIKAGQAQQVAFNKQVQEDFTKKFGDRAPQVMNTYNAAVSATPDGDSAKAYLQSLGPEARSAMATVFNNFASKYVSEDKLDIKDGILSQGQPMTEKDYGDEFTRLLTIQRNSKPTSAEYMQAKEAMTKLRALGPEIFKK